MWNTIKQVLKKNKGTCIIVEEGKPAFVVVPFDDYEKSLDKPANEKVSVGTGEQELLEKINQEIINWKTKQAEDSPAVELVEDSDEVKIENLPLM
jgi:PHD/YefM family antitoxin component YafN of YafNO toxin-antitoxin module